MGEGPQTQGRPSLRWLIVPPLLSAGLAAAVVAGVMLWEPWEGGEGKSGDRVTTGEQSATPSVTVSPTPSRRPELTRIEAQAAIESWFNREYQLPVQNGPSPGLRDVLGYRDLDCSNIELNETTEKWVARCTFHAINLGRNGPVDLGTDLHLTVQVDLFTGRVRGCCRRR